jgi:hypothetical protein
MKQDSGHVLDSDSVVYATSYLPKLQKQTCGFRVNKTPSKTNIIISPPLLDSDFRSRSTLRQFQTSSSAQEDFITILHSTYNCAVHHVTSSGAETAGRKRSSRDPRGSTDGPGSHIVYVLPTAKRTAARTNRNRRCQTDPRLADWTGQEYPWHEASSSSIFLFRRIRPRSSATSLGSYPPL